MNSLQMFQNFEKIGCRNKILIGELLVDSFSSEWSSDRFWIYAHGREKEFDEILKIRIGFEGTRIGTPQPIDYSKRRYPIFYSVDNCCDPFLRKESDKEFRVSRYWIGLFLNILYPIVLLPLNVILIRRQYRKFKQLKASRNEN